MAGVEVERSSAIGRRDEDAKQPYELDHGNWTRHTTTHIVPAHVQLHGICPNGTAIAQFIRQHCSHVREQ
jgi:hypothetical protein